MALELAGVIDGGVTLASLFTSCVGCFEYVQLGRNFGKDYQQSLLDYKLFSFDCHVGANSPDYGRTKPVGRTLCNVGTIRTRERDGEGPAGRDFGPI